MDNDNKPKLAPTPATADVAQVVLQSFIENFKDVLIFSIDRDYHYLNYNSIFKDSTFQVYGTTVAKGGSMLESILDETERQKAKTACDRAIAGESHATIEIYGTLQRIYYKTRYNPIVTQDGKIIGVTVMAADITESKLAEEKIAGLNTELEAFSYSIAHDLRAPLRSIHGFSEILLDEYNQKLDDEGQRLLKVISNNSRKMGHMVDDLLNFAKLGRSAVAKQTIAPAILLREILDELITAEDKNRVTVELGDLLSLKCDETLMRNVFTNLISNAIKYSRKKTKAIIRISSSEDAQQVTYAVADNGVGFEMQYADKLFGVFNRLHKNTEFEGNGVGLAIAQRIILKHSGKIWAEAELNKGATFYFSLPK